MVMSGITPVVMLGESPAMSEENPVIMLGETPVMMSGETPATVAGEHRFRTQGLSCVPTAIRMEGEEGENHQGTGMGPVLSHPAKATSPLTCNVTLHHSLPRTPLPPPLLPLPDPRCTP